MRANKALMLVLAFFLLLGACNKGQKYGSSKLENLKDAKAREALGRIANSPLPSSAPTGTGGAIGNKSPTPSEGPTQKANQTLEIKLIGDPPYYDPGQELSAAQGTAVHIINKDDKNRRFVISDLGIDSGELAPGKTYDFSTSKIPKAKYQISDGDVPFATGTLTIN